VTPKEACGEWVRVLRAVAAGELSYAEALVRRPAIDDEMSDEVPSAFWSARELLEEEIKFGMPELPETKAYFAERMAKLADRIERHASAKP
jgi:hypothetical protein